MNIFCVILRLFFLSYIKEALALKWKQHDCKIVIIKYIIIITVEKVVILSDELNSQ